MISIDRVMPRLPSTEKAVSKFPHMERPLSESVSRVGKSTLKVGTRALVRGAEGALYVAAFYTLAKAVVTFSY